MSPVLSLIRPAVGRLGLAALAGFGAAASGVALTAAAAWLILRAAEHPPVLHLTVAIVAVRAFGISRSPLRYLERLFGHDAAFRVLGELRARTYAALERLTPSGLRGLRSGDVVTRFVSDMDGVVDGVTRVLLPVTVAALLAAATAGLLGSLVPLVGILLAAGALLAGLGGPVLQNTVAGRAFRRIAPLRGEVSAQIVELIHGAADLLAYQAAEERLARVIGVDRSLRRAEARSSLSVGLGGALLVLAGGSCVWGALAIGTAAVRAGTLDPVLLGVLVLTPLAFFDALVGLPAATADAGRARGALRRIRALLDQPTPVPDPIPATSLMAGPYHLRAEGLRARWPGAGEDAVIHADIDLPPGAHVALVGPSGCGKSTVAALLARLLDPAGGRVTLNGVDLRHLAGDDVRRIVGYVAEDAHIFDSTIADNLRLGRPDATTADLWAAARAVRLDGWMASLPDGLATRVGERGERLSGGQRRRLVLARALLADCPIMVLDEPTEHLDEATAEAVTTELLAAVGDRSVLLITHQPYGLRDVDTVVAMVHGRTLAAAPSATVP